MCIIFSVENNIECVYIFFRKNVLYRNWKFFRINFLLSLNFVFLSLFLFLTWLQFRVIKIKRKNWERKKVSKVLHTSFSIIYFSIFLIKQFFSLSSRYAEPWPWSNYRGNIRFFHLIRPIILYFMKNDHRSFSW